MAYPYTFPNTSTDFANAVPAPSASLCGKFVSALLKVPLMVANFMATVMDTNGAISSKFLSMIYAPGDVKASAAALANSAVWLRCVGQEVAKAQYPDLYAAIGDVYGTAPWPAPSNGNNFRLPNYQCQTLVGVGAVTATGGSPPTGPFFSSHSYAIGSQVGEDSHVLNLSECAPHQHDTFNSDTSQTSIASTTGFATYNNNANNNAGYVVSGTTTIPSLGPTTVAGGAVSTDSDASSFVNYGSDYKATPHNNIQPGVAVYYYIFAGVPAY